MKTIYKQIYLIMKPKGKMIKSQGLKLFRHELLSILLFFLGVSQLWAVNVDVTVKTSLNNSISGATVQFSQNNFSTYSTVTTNGSGVASKDLATGTWKIKAIYNNTSSIQTMIVGTDPNPTFYTTEVRTQVNDHSGVAIPSNVTVHFSTNNFSTYVTVAADGGGFAKTELFPGTCSIRANYHGTSAIQNSITIPGDGASAGSSSSVTMFYTSESKALVQDCALNPLAGLSVQFSNSTNFGTWISATTDNSGIARTEMFPGNWDIKVISNNTSKIINIILAGDGKTGGQGTTTPFTPTKVSFTYSGPISYWIGYWTSFTSPSYMFPANVHFRFGGSGGYEGDIAISGCDLGGNVHIFKTLKADGSALPNIRIQRNDYGNHYVLVGNTDANGYLFSLSQPNGTWKFMADKNYSTKYITAAPSTFIFQTAKFITHVNRQNGTSYEGIRTQYSDYGNHWIDLDPQYTDANGNASIELFPGNFQFKASKDYSSSTKNLEILNSGTSDIVTFQTSKFITHVLNHDGTDYAGIRTQYNDYGNHWIDLDPQYTGPDGKASIELFPGNFSFKASKDYSSQTESLEITGEGTSDEVGFQTALAIGLVKDCDLNSPIQGINVQYNDYGNHWMNISPASTGSDGKASIELFPGTFNLKANIIYTSQTVQIVLTRPSTQVEFNPTRVCISSGTLQYNDYGSHWMNIPCGTYMFPGTYNFKVNGAVEVSKIVNGCSQNLSIAPCTASSIGVTSSCGSNVLTAPEGNSYLWSNGETSQSVSVTSSGTYSVVVNYDFTCFGTSGGSINPSVNTTVTQVPLPPDVSVVDNNNNTSTLTATGVSGSSILWNDGSTEKIHIVTSSGDYSATQTVNGCTSPPSISITADPQSPSSPAPTITVVDYCGYSVLTASDYTGTLLWSDGGTDYSHTVTEAGDYTVTQTVNGNTSAPSNIASAAPKSIPAAPTVTVTDNCDGTSVMTASNYSGSLLWSNGATTSSITLTTACTKSVTQTVDGCTSDPGNGTSSPKMTPSTPSIGSNSPVCAGNILSLTSSSTGTPAPTASWAGAGTFNSSSAANPNVTNAATGDYMVTYTNSCGSTSASVSVTVNTAPSSATAGSNSPICSGTSLNLTSSASGSPAPTAFWTGTGTFSSATAQNPSVTGAASGNYIVTYTNSCGTTSASTAVTVNPLPGTPAIIGTASVLTGGTYNYSASITNASSYSWSYSGSGATITGNGTSTITIVYMCNATGGILTVKGNNSCGDGPSATLSITSSPGAIINIYSAKLTTGAGKNPPSVKSAIMPIAEPGTAMGFKVFRSNKIGMKAIRKNFDNIWHGDCTDANGKCNYNPASDVTALVNVTGPSLVNYGGGPAYKYVMTVPAGKRYLIIAKDAADATACDRYDLNYPCFVYPGKRTHGTGHENGTDHYKDNLCDADDDGDDDGDDDVHLHACTCTGSVNDHKKDKDMFLQIIEDAKGKVRPGNTDDIPGSKLLIASPSYIDFTDTVEMLPIVYESVDGDWGVSVMASPPEGFYSIPDGSLSTDVSTLTMNALQFVLVDTGSEWTATEVKTNLIHNGRSITYIVRPGMIDRKEAKNYLAQNFPNPFSSSTTIPYIIPVASHVRIAVYDIFGREVSRLIDRDQESGEYQIEWKGCDELSCDLPSGIYMVRLEAMSTGSHRGVINSRRMIFIK